MKIKIQLILCLILLVLFSACIKEEPKEVQVVKGYTYGLAIREFNSLDKVYPGEEIEATLYVQNVGDEKARDIKAELYQRGSLELLEPKIKTVTDLSSPDPEFGIKGEIGTIYWTLKGPEDVRTEKTQTLRARVTYDYTSRASTNVYLVGRDAWIEQGVEAFPVYSTSSTGPVTISIIPLPAIKVNEKGNKDVVDVVLNLLVRNTGSGTIVGNLRDFKLFVKHGDKRPVDITDSCKADLIEISRSSKKYELKPYGKEQERSVRCSFDLDYEGDMDDATSYIVEASANYTYYIDTPPLTVKLKV